MASTPRGCIGAGAFGRTVKKTNIITSASPSLPSSAFPSSPPSPLLAKLRVHEQVNERAASEVDSLNEEGSLSFSRTRSEHPRLGTRLDVPMRTLEARSPRHVRRKRKC
jgi:hypothetical protein